MADRPADPTGPRAPSMTRTASAEVDDRRAAAPDRQERQDREDRQAGHPPVPPKLDPETLVLRGSPLRAIRFRRGLVIAIAGSGAVAVAGLGWLGLAPVDWPAAAPEPTIEPPRSSRDVLANAPADYGDVPRLGPPLPGDLGRAILAHDRALGLDPTRSPDIAAPHRQAQAQEAAAQAREAEAKAARESGLMVQISAQRAAAADDSSASSSPSLDEGAVPIGPAPGSASVDSAAPTAQDRQLAFLGSGTRGRAVNPNRVVAPASPHMLAAGTVIAASLITGLDSDLPGLVTAQVTENVHDSVTGRTLLIPQGARLIGRYDAQVSYGQRRALVVWDRLLFPDGSSIALDTAPATDAAGRAGLSDRIDEHGGTLLKGIALATLLGIGTQLSVESDDDLAEVLRESVQGNAARAGDRIIQRQLDVRPTLTVRPGWPVRVLVAADLVLTPWTP